MQTIALPLAGLSSRCKMPISLPQVLGFMQYGAGRDAGRIARWTAGRGAISGAQNALPTGGAPAVPGAASRAGNQRVQVNRSFSDGGRGPCRAWSGASMVSWHGAVSDSTSSGSSAFSVRNIKKNTTHPIAASNNQLISR